MSLPIATQRFVKGTLLLLIAAYAGDYVWFRVRLIHPKPADPLESFTVPRILAIPENSGKTGYEIDQQNPEQTFTCVHRSEEHTSVLQSRGHLVCRLLLEK